VFKNFGTAMHLTKEAGSEFVGARLPPTAKPTTGTLEEDLAAAIHHPNAPGLRPGENFGNCGRPLRGHEGHQPAKTIRTPLGMT
jgi:hypothetical protein